MTRERTLWLLAVLAVVIEIAAWAATRDVVRKTEIGLTI